MAKFIATVHLPPEGKQRKGFYFKFLIVAASAELAMMKLSQSTHGSLVTSANVKGGTVDIVEICNDVFPMSAGRE